MKKIVVFFLLVFAFAGSAVAEPDAQKAVPISLSVDDLAAISRVLSGLPYGQVAGVMDLLRQREFEAQKAAEAAASKDIKK